MSLEVNWQVSVTVKNNYIDSNSISIAISIIDLYNVDKLVEVLFSVKLRNKEVDINRERIYS